MARRPSKRTRHARWILAAGIAAGVGAYTWLHHGWAFPTGCLTMWALIGITRLTLRTRAHSWQRPSPAPTRTASPQLRLEYQQHVLYAAVDHHGGLLYVGVCVVHPSRSLEDRRKEHEDEPDHRWRTDVGDVYPIGYYAGRRLVMEAEARAIHELRPPWNATHRRHPLSRCPTLLRARALEAAA